MPIVLAFVAVAGLAVVVLLIAEHRRQRRVWARLNPAGYQEAWVTINGRYHPSTIAVRQGVPLRLYFLRNEDTPCSERIILSGFGVNRRLPAFQETTVELVPTTAGTFLFTCQWGVYRGRLVVTLSREKTGIGRAALPGPRQQTEMPRSGRQQQRDLQAARTLTGTGARIPSEAVRPGSQATSTVQGGNT